MRSLLLAALAVALWVSVSLGCPNAQAPAAVSVAAPAAVAFAQAGAAPVAPVVAVPAAPVFVPQAAPVALPQFILPQIAAGQPLVALPVQALAVSAPVVSCPLATANAVSVSNASFRCQKRGLLAELALERQVARQARAAVRQSRKTGSAAAAIAISRN